MFTHRRFLLVGLLTSLVGLVAAGTEAESCFVNGVNEAVRCFAVDVPEAWGARSSRRLRIRTIVLPALGKPTHEPLLLLQGGPGVAGTLMAPGFARRQVLREGRDLVFIDQRGTGGSGLLTCASLGRFNFLGALFPKDHIAACRRSVERRADVTQYANAASAEDLEAVRKALGVESWSIIGYSFGTRLAQVYARRYPRRVKAIILDGVVPFDAQLTADFAGSMERSLNYVVGRCERDPECNRLYPGTRRSIAAIAQQLERAPVQVRVTDSTGRILSGPFTRWDFAYAVRGMLYGQLAAAIPAWVHEAERTKNFNNFAWMYWQRTRWVGDSTSVPLHLGVYCSEDLPFTDSVEAVRRANGTLIGPRYYQEYRAACAAWPVPPTSLAMREPWVSDIPALLFSGERDPVTPPEYGERVVKGLARARHVVIRGGGHADAGWCKSQLIVEFLNDPAKSLPMRACLDALDFPDFQR